MSNISFINFWVFLINTKYNFTTKIVKCNTQCWHLNLLPPSLEISLLLTCIHKADQGPIPNWFVPLNVSHEVTGRLHVGK